jgi:hypothetical protein
MKTKLKYTLLSSLIAAGTFFIVKQVREAKEKIFRMAAGESPYEKKCKRKKIVK